jgi:hypothetical protein
VTPSGVVGVRQFGTRLHDVTSQKTAFFTSAIVRSMGLRNISLCDLIIHCLDTAVIMSDRRNVSFKEQPLHVAAELSLCFVSLIHFA